MIGIGLVGYGYWGANLARNLVGAGARIVAISDQRDDRLVLASALYSDVDLVREWREVTRHPNVDAVVVATPPTTHFQIAFDCLAAGKNVLVEKPMTTSVDQARRLVDAAAAAGRILMVDHTFLYASSIQAIRRMIGEGDLGELQYYNSVRIGPRPQSIDVDVLWDLAAHDIAILDHLVEDRPERVTAVGIGHPAGLPADDVHITFAFGSGFISHVHVSWLSPVKIRRVMVGGSRGMISYDDMEPIEKLQVHEQTIGAPGIWTPKIDTGETLTVVAKEFLDCIGSGRRPLADGEAGLRTVEILEVASASLKLGGQMMPVREAYAR